MNRNENYFEYEFALLNQGYLSRDARSRCPPLAKEANREREVRKSRRPLPFPRDRRNLEPLDGLLRYPLFRETFFAASFAFFRIGVISMPKMKKKPLKKSILYVYNFNSMLHFFTWKMVPSSSGNNRQSSSATRGSISWPSLPIFTCLPSFQGLYRCKVDAKGSSFLQIQSTLKTPPSALADNPGGNT